ncbi:MAG: efflux RND transporter periplasmic adaptor subunit [Pirellulales bacterium]
MASDSREASSKSSSSGSSAAAIRSAQVQSLRLPPTPAGSRASPLPWLLCFLLIAAVGWLVWRERQLKVTFSRVLAEVQEGGEWDGDGASSGANGDPSGGDSNGGGASGGGTTSGGPSGGGATGGERRASSGGAARAAAMGEIALESKGYVIPAHQILVSPQVSGRLLRLFVEEGQRFTQGDLLGEIESTEYAADYARATATLALNRSRLQELETGNRPEEIEQAKADQAEAEAQLAQLEAEYERAKRLIQSSVITQQDFELIESRHSALKRRLTRLTFAVKLMVDGPRQERIDSARAEVQQAEADVAKAKWRLDNCRILAPISGTILKKNAEEGNIVNPIAFNGSFSVCDMADLSDLEVSLDIQERDVSRVFKGQKCRVRADAFPDRIYYGFVSRLMPIADRAKGAVPVRVKLTVPSEEEGVYLKPEMGAVVAFLNGPAETPTVAAPAKPTAAPPAEEPPAAAKPDDIRPSPAPRSPSADPNFKPDLPPTSTEGTER